MVNNSRRLVGIDVLRAFAVLGVVGDHLHQVGGLVAPPHAVIEKAAWDLVSVGGNGLVLFFAISGFVITDTVIRRDGALSRMRVGAFYLRRIARIWPALILSIALGIAAMAAASRGSAAARLFIFGDAPFTAAFWLSIATFTFNLWRFYAVLRTGHDWGFHWIVLWSLSVEEQFYLFFPLIARRAGSRRRLFAALGVAIAIGIASRYSIPYLAGRSMLLTPACLDPLAIGVAAALMPRLPLDRGRSVRLAVLGLIVLLLGTVCHLIVAAPTLIGLGAALVMLCCRDGAVFTHLWWRPLARVGRVSYGMYLFHPLVLWGMMPTLHGMAFLPALALFVAATVLAAEISFAAIERPAGRWILNRWSALRTHAGDAAGIAGAIATAGAEPIPIRARGSD